MWGNKLKQRLLGKTGIKISEIGLGCASFWGKNIFSEKTAIRIVHNALDKGVNFFDTGHSYSAGNAEIRLGKALSHLTDKSNLCLSTKAGTRLNNKGQLFKDFSTDWVAESCHQSLKKLSVDTLGVFHLHGPNPEDFNDDLLTTITNLRQQGKVRSLAINSFNEHIIEMAVATGVFDCVMLDYNLMTQNRTSLINKLDDNNVAVLAAAPLAGAFYSNRLFKIRGIKDLWYLARALKNSPNKFIQGRKYKFINKYHNFTGAQIALAYVLNNPKISCAVFGTTDLEHLSENLKASEVSLPTELLKKIQGI